MARECYAQNLKVVLYLVSRLDKYRTSLNLIYPKRSEEPADQDKGKAPKVCHTEELGNPNLPDKVLGVILQHSKIWNIDLDPRVKFDENRPNFDEPMSEM